MKKYTTIIIVSIVGLAIGAGIGYKASAQYRYGNFYPNQARGYMMGQMGYGYGMGTGNLYGLTGDQFDQAFLSQMIVHHEGALAMAQAALQNSKRPEIIQLAKDIIANQTKEIQTMNDWQTKWFNQ